MSLKDIFDYLWNVNLMEIYSYIVFILAICLLGMFVVDIIEKRKK